MLETLSSNQDGGGEVGGSGIGISIGSEYDAAPDAASSGAITGLGLGVLHAVLNQVDYGLAVVNADTRQLVYANAPALDDLAPDRPHKTGLCVVDGLAATRHPAHAAQLMLALARTKALLRSLLHLADGGPAGAGNANGTGDGTVAVMPLFETTLPISGSNAGGSADPSYALLVFPKRQLCDTTTMTLFARERGLTGTEGQELALVCKGLRASQIASSHGVQVSTVRSQLRSIRYKTASDSVRALVDKVSVLPPMARHLSNVFGAA